MILKIFLSLAVFYALILSVKYRKTFPIVITLGLMAGIIFTFLQPTIDHFPGIYLYMGFVLLAFIYGIAVKQKDVMDRIIICLMSASVFIYWLWVLNHWHGNEILAPILVLVAGGAGIIAKAKLKNELGFLVILAADAIAILIEHVMKVS